MHENAGCNHISRDGEPTPRRTIRAWWGGSEADEYALCGGDAGNTLGRKRRQPWASNGPPEGSPWTGVSAWTAVLAVLAVVLAAVLAAWPEALRPDMAARGYKSCNAQPAKTRAAGASDGRFERSAGNTPWPLRLRTNHSTAPAPAASVAEGSRRTLYTLASLASLQPTKKYLPSLAWPGRTASCFMRHATWLFPSLPSVSLGLAAVAFGSIVLHAGVPSAMGPYDGVTQFCSRDAAIYVLRPSWDSRGIALLDRLPRWYRARRWDDHIPGMALPT
ncbi:hypothetical protein F5Y12DRAFT_711192 [Xylaria sp. FL1777]|nr:hypothetical protein F5Y12DRAFT_711192 [Xylaria sp. FL1777]